MAAFHLIIYGRFWVITEEEWHNVTDSGTPLDNNIVERALKRAVLHRKNALYYRSLNGAQVAQWFAATILQRMVIVALSGREWRGSKKSCRILSTGTTIEPVEHDPQKPDRNG
jgi:hypothetical protein